MSEDDKIQKYVYDLNWINNILHDFTNRLVFMEITEEYRKHKNVPLISNICNAMANDAVLKITSIYDKNSNVLSIYYILRWIQKNQDFIKKYVHTLNLDLTNNDIDLITKKIKKFEPLIKKFRDVRNMLVGHSNRQIVDMVDIRRNLMNKKIIKSKEIFIQESINYMKKVSGFLLEIKDFVEIRKRTIEILDDLKKVLKMPDRIFGKSGNSEEWENFYESQKRETRKIFEQILNSN
jgi:hypothetical protein